MKSAGVTKKTIRKAPGGANLWARLDATPQEGKDEAAMSGLLHIPTMDDGEYRVLRFTYFGRNVADVSPVPFR
jgi:hypothetical protein